MNVLICSQYGELQVEEVSHLLVKMGLRPILFERYRKDQFISYEYGKKVTAFLKIQGEEFPLNKATFPAVWYRPKPVILSEIPGETAKIQEKFCMQEWRVILQSLDIFLTESKWINSVGASQKAANKALQLKVAKGLGLNIPATIITNDAMQALTLFNDRRVIYKTLSSFFTAKEAIYTNEIQYEQVKKSHQEIAMAPGIFQEYINKAYELRITLIGEEFFIVKINSQSLEQSAIDWRRRPDPELYEEGHLTTVTRQKLLQFHKQLGLVYAAYDFIVDVKGREFFIECNPSGQWLWLENTLKMNMSQVMANQLACC